MSPLSLPSRDLARKVLALEAASMKGAAGSEGSDPANPMHAVVQVCEKLRTLLTLFAGAYGFHSLLSRALTLAKAQDPSLAVLWVRPDGSLSGLDALPGDSDPTAVISCSETLVAQLLDLLIVFIGEPLTHKLLHSAWPDLPPGAFHTGTEDVS